MTNSSSLSPPSLPSDNPNAFTGNPLDRCSERRGDPDWIAAQLSRDDAIMIPLWRGDPLLTSDGAAWLSTAARSEFSAKADIVFLGLSGESPVFAIDASPSAQTSDAAPFADLGDYVPLREGAGQISETDLAIIGHARSVLDWHRRHHFCANCGAATEIVDGGIKRTCPSCGTEHFPRTDPVAIVLAIHEGACLLGRSPHFPPTFFSALAGYVEPGETPEECAVRELYEEAGTRLTRVQYLFSQPWPFPSSLMMGFLADASDRTLTLDETEIVEALWVDKQDIQSILAGEFRDDLRLPPRFTIARQLIEHWAAT
ncbi:MAG: NAD(+) diphosphatase [Pseudomonadota bacterium]